MGHFPVLHNMPIFPGKQNKQFSFFLSQIYFFVMSQITDINKLPPGSCVTFDYIHDTPAKKLSAAEVGKELAFFLQETKKIHDQHKDWSTTRIRGQMLNHEDKKVRKKAMYFSQSHPRIFATATEVPPNTQRLQEIHQFLQLKFMVESGQCTMQMADMMAREMMVSAHKREMTPEEKKQFEEKGTLLQDDKDFEKLSPEEKMKKMKSAESAIGQIGAPFEVDFGNGSVPFEPTKELENFLKK
jgi:hypothetical protein